MSGTIEIVSHFRQARKRILTSALVAAIGVILISCGGEPTLEEYFAEVSRITEDADKRIQELTAESTGGFESLEAAREIYPEYVEAYQDFVQRIDGLRAPALVVDAHRNFVATSKELQAINKDRLERLNEAQDDSELEEIFGVDEEYTAAVERQNDACVVLQRTAEGKGISVPGLANCEET